MATHDFTDPTEAVAAAKKSYREELSRDAGRLVSQLADFKNKYDTLYSLSTTEQQATLTSKFTAFKVDAKAALGL